MPLGPDVPLDEVMYFDAATHVAATGAASDADAAPTFAVYEEATDTDIGVGGNMTKRTSLTGHYRGSFTASAANGFEVGKWYAIYVTAVVSSITANWIVGNFRCVAAEAVVGFPKVDLTYILGTLLTETAGQIAAAFKKFFNIATPASTMDALADIQSRLPAALTGDGNIMADALKLDGEAIVQTTGKLWVLDGFGDAVMPTSHIAATGGKVDGVALVDVTTTNTDMRGTNNAATATALATTDGKVDAVKAKTDSLTFTVAGEVDANIQSVNDVNVTGDGQTGTEWGPA